MYFLYAITFILAACSLLYELLMAQAISSFATNSVVWYSLTVGFYLGAMGTGALLCTRICGKKQSWISLFRVEVLLSCAGAASVMVVYAAHMLMGYLWIREAYVFSLCLFYSLSFLMIIVVGFLTGLELPLLIKIGNELSGKKKITNRILGADYFGSLAGGVAFPLVLLPHFELLTVALITASLNLMIAFFIFLSFVKNQKNLVLTLVVNNVLVLLLIFGFSHLSQIQQYFLKKYYYYEYIAEDLSTLLGRMDHYPDVERYHSPYQKIDIVRMPELENPLESLIAAYTSKYREDPDFPKYYVLALDGASQFWTGFEEMYHEYFAHIPIILSEDVPHNVLVMGAGDGFLIKELVKYPGIESITLVELDKKMIELARTHAVLRYANKGSLDDPRVKIIIADAFHYIRESDEKFDLIYMDFPDPNDYHLSKLYSREFYAFVGKHLKNDGFAVLDAPWINMFSPGEASMGQGRDPYKEWEIYYQTLKAAGFETIIPFVSALETDNPEARAIVSRFIGDTRQLIVKEQNETGQEVRQVIGKEAIVTQILDGFQKEQQQRFIMVKKGEGEINFTYKDRGIKLYVLNEQRFHLAFDTPSVVPKTLNRAKVNSLMRPSIPDMSFWWRLRAIK